jgi:hypothetical protein
VTAKCCQTCAPPPPPKQPVPPPEDERDGILDGDAPWEISFRGAATDDAYMAGGSIAIDGKWVGVHVAIEALGVENVTGPLHENDPGDPALWGSAHLTWSLIADPHVRIRILTGGSVLALPKTQYTMGQVWAGKTVCGPDLGVTIALDLAKSFGAEGWARLTPYPVRVSDMYGGIAIRNGPVGVTAGWREVEVSGDGVDAPAISFEGPQAGLSLRF